MKKKGFTLIEIMITLAIFSLFVGFLYNAYFSQIKENNSFNSRLNLKYNGDKAMDLITNELRSIVIPLSTGRIYKVTSSGKDIIDLTLSTGPAKLKLTPQKTLIDNLGSNPLVLCQGITSIKMEFGDATKNEEELIIITIDLQSKNDSYTVTS
ncbi:MAG: prepilin-type N-terminal cleavage/methylation domain-containing protein, partial [Clostridiaceae bacterium]|nr:prepilin-type N-terminal cleavage/methylation domain-containing protein [Clostridiaceae bacterium]